MTALLLFLISITGGICVTCSHSPLLLLGILGAETLFVLKFPAFREAEKVWAFVFFSGTMLPVHMCWLYPAIITMFAADAYFAVFLFLIIFGCFSAELLLFLFFIHYYLEYRRKHRPEG